MKSLWSSLLCALLVLMVSPAAAHRGHDALSVVTLAADGGVTVSHRFEAHDIEPALAQIAPDAQPSLDDPDAQQALIAYVAANFRMATNDGPIRLAVSHVDFGSDIVRIEFSGKVRNPVRRLGIGSRLLNGVYRRQVNQVNVRFGKTVRTLTFVDDDEQFVDIN
ncbi:DUF6702 family protein [Sphingorhabdus sp.]|uniref:DUF6702 family protein n=1 Tax=Sphingorhabdus sp. TaxID=1902408 RepID=UPI003D814148